MTLTGWIILSGLITVIGILIGYLISKKIRKEHYSQKETGMYPQGYFYTRALLYWMPFYLIIAIILSHIWPNLDNLYTIIYPTLFVLPAYLIQKWLEKQHKDRIMPAVPVKHTLFGKIMLGILIMFCVAFMVSQVYFYFAGLALVR